ncbi:MAG: hypothetical protein ABJ381_20015, partial [Ilumatobacter sp.]
MSDPNSPTHPARPSASTERGVNWTDPARRPPPDFDSQRRQRNALIGLGVASAIVLLIGSVAFLASRSGGTGAVAEVSTPEVTSAPSAVDTTTTSSTTTSAPTTLPPPVGAAADAGPDLDVDAGSVVTLQASTVTEGAGDDDVTWRQISGPDVTAGVGALGGRAVSFGAPDEIVTLQFELVVSSGDRAATAPEAVDALTVRVFEQADATVFVDAETGDDAGDGSMESPLRSLAVAAAMASDGADLYVRSVGTYVEADPILLGPGTSLYGGFDENWNRDRAVRARIDAASVGIIVEGDGDRRVSAIDLTAASAEPGRRSIGVRVADAETVTVEDSRIVSGDAGNGTSDDDDPEIGVAGTSVGILAVDTGELRVERSTVNGGRGGDGVSPTRGSDVSPGGSGADGDGDEAGAGGVAGDDDDGSQAGGDGAPGASNGAGADAEGDDGGGGGEDRGDDGGPGLGGEEGDGGGG